MKDLKLIRRTIGANTIEHFEFDVKGYEYLVKNFNNFDIYVAFKSTNDEDEMIKIPANCSQVCVINKSTYSEDLYIFAENSGEVEVQCLRY